MLYLQIALILRLPRNSLVPGEPSVYRITEVSRESKSFFVVRNGFHKTHLDWQRQLLFELSYPHLEQMWRIGSPVLGSSG